MNRYEWPENVEVVDAGTMGLSMLHMFDGVDFMVVVDAVDGTGHPAGTVVLMDPAAIAPNVVKHSMHDMRFVDVLEAARAMGREVEAVVVGVQVLDMSDVGLELSEPVEAAIPDAVRAVLQVLSERGVTAVRVEGADSDDGAALDRILRG
jgi:hydrogenase maturation protease